MKFNPIISFMIFLCMSTAHANLLKVTVTSTTATGVELTAVNAMVAELEASLNKGLPDADASNYLEGMANSGGFAAKGMGSDYANDIDLFVFGVNVGPSADLGDSSGGSLNADSARGFSANGSILFGMNLGVFDLPKWEYFDLNKIRVFVNLLPPGLVEQKSDTQEIELGHIGVHARYSFLEPKAFAPFGLATWGGVHIHTGLEITSLRFVSIQPYATTGTNTSGGLTMNYNANGKATVGAEVSAVSIPVEISTNFQFGYAFTLFTGLGMDITSSSADAIADVSVPTTATVSGGSNPTVNLSVTGDLGQNGTGSAFGARAFIGLQANISLVKLYVHANKGIGNGLLGANAGLKFAW